VGKEHDATDNIGKPRKFEKYGRKCKREQFLENMNAIDP
jgi:hypothetical protein